MEVKNQANEQNGGYMASFVRLTSNGIFLDDQFKESHTISKKPNNMITICEALGVKYFVQSTKLFFKS